MKWLFILSIYETSITLKSIAASNVLSIFKSFIDISTFILDKRNDISLDYTS